jgi:glutathione S-transferase
VTVVLYDSAVSGNCYKVRLLFALLGVEYERRPLSVVDKSDREEVLGGLNPGLRVPTVVLDDGRPLGESGAILWYFADGTQYVPSDPYDRAKVLQWMFFEQYSHEPAIAVVRFLVAYSGEAERYASVIERKTADGYRALDALEAHLGREDGSYVVGTRMGLGDIALYAYTHGAGEGGFDLAGYPAIRAWLDRVAAEPGHVPIDA